MKNKITFLIIVLISFSSCRSQNKIEYNKNIDTTLKYYVILMGGQSNMRGQGRLSDLERAKFENITYYDFGLSPSLKRDTKSFGPEVGLSEILSEKYPDKNFILIKYAIGGSSMLDWSPDYDPEKAKITAHPEYGNMYNTFLRRVDSLTDRLDAHIIALMWAQGAADARVPAAGNEYYENFELFISSIRSDLELLNCQYSLEFQIPPRLDIQLSI